MFDLVKTSKTGKLEVFKYRKQKINQRDAKKDINRFRRQLKKQYPEAKISISFKVKHEDAQQNENYFWNSLPLASVDNDVILPTQYHGRIAEISLQVVKT